MKTKLFLFALAFAAILSACNTKTKTEQNGCPKADSACVKKDSACCKKADSTEYSKIIAAKLFIKPEKVNEFVKMFQAMTDSTLKEPGCTGYQLYQNPYDKNSFLVFETYKNQAAIDAHFAASYFKAFGEKMQPIASKPAELVIYDVAKEDKK